MGDEWVKPEVALKAMQLEKSENPADVDVDEKPSFWKTLWRKLFY